MYGAARVGRVLLLFSSWLLVLLSFPDEGVVGLDVATRSKRHLSASEYILCRIERFGSRIEPGRILLSVERGFPSSSGRRSLYQGCATNELWKRVRTYCLSVDCDVDAEFERRKLCNAKCSVWSCLASKVSSDVMILVDGRASIAVLSRCGTSRIAAATVLTVRTSLSSSAL